jgi:hypothetical protein
MQMQKKIIQHHNRPVPPIVRRRMSKDASPNLRIADVIAD